MHTISSIPGLFHLTRPCLIALLFLICNGLSAQPSPEDYVNLEDRKSGNVVEMYYRFDAHFRMEAPEKNSYQWFTIDKLGNGFNQIVTVRDYSYNLADPGYNETELIRKSDSDVDYYQQWEFKKDPRLGWLTIINRETGRCLEATYEDANGPATGIIMADCDGSTKQQFNFRTAVGRPVPQAPPANIRPAPPKTYSVSLTNESMWTVSFRIKTESGWSSWKTFGSGKQTFFGNGSVVDIEIQWKDLAKWKVYNGPMPIIPKNSKLSMTIAGNTFKPIYIK